MVDPVPPRYEGPASASFSIALRAERAGAAQLYADLGGGFAERLSSRVDLKSSAEFVDYTFALPGGNVEGLRFDPIDQDASVTLARASIKDAAGNVLLAFFADDFVPAQQIARLERRGEELVVEPISGGNDPALWLKLRAPLVLPGIASPEIAAAEKHAGALQRGVATGLAVAGIALAFLLWRSTPPRRGLEIVAVLWAALCVMYSRRPDVLTCPQFWAEDGTVFFAQQHAMGWKAALQTHGGYLHLVPRLTAGVADYLGARAAPAIYLGVALVVVLIAVARATSRRIALPHPYWCALAVVLIPNMDEIAFNLTNAQWFGAIVLLLVACSRPPETRAEWAGDIAAVIVFGLSGPFSVFFLPLFVVRALRWRTRGTMVTALLIALVGSLQLVAYWHSPAPPSLGTPFSPGHALAAAGYRTGGQLLNVLPPPLVTDPIAWGACGLVLWLLLWALLPVAKEFRATRWLLLAGALLVLAGGLWRYRETVDVFFNRIHVQRYLHLPLVATCWLLLAALKDAAGWRKGLIVAIGLVILLRNAPWYRVAPNVDYAWASHAVHIDRGENTEVPINPAGWVVSVPARK